MARPADDQSHRQRERPEPGRARDPGLRLHGALRRGPPEPRRRGPSLLPGHALHRPDRDHGARRAAGADRRRQADVRPISGNAANTAIALGWLRGGDPIIVNSTAAGGHISHNTIGVFGRRIQNRGASLSLESETRIPLHFFPLAEDMYHLDVPKSIDLIERVRPRLIVLGKSLILFPEPLKELAQVCRSRDIPVLYDAAHVFGLIVGGQFQDPWREGATWVTASTHKTFPGPQRGVIVSDLDEETREALLALGRPRRVPRLVQQSPPAHAAGSAGGDP